jgi:hypothetical protein
MTSDRYTKVVLTVIAGALLYICAMMSGVPLSAQSTGWANLGSPGTPQAVYVVGWGTITKGQLSISMVTDQNGTHTNPTLPMQLQRPQEPIPVALGYNTQNPMPVTLGSTLRSPLPVELSSIKAGASWDLIRTRVEQSATERTPGAARD